MRSTPNGAFQPDGRPAEVVEGEVLPPDPGWRLLGAGLEPLTAEQAEAKLHWDDERWHRGAPT